jgi:hypothetical protein
MIDLRYYETLQRIIAQAEAEKKAHNEIKAAREYLDSIFSFCTGDWYWVGIVNGTAQEWGDDWFYDRWRGTMRTHILSIKKKVL